MRFLVGSFFAPDDLRVEPAFPPGAVAFVSLVFEPAAFGPVAFGPLVRFEGDVVLEPRLDLAAFVDDGFVEEVADDERVDRWLVLFLSSPIGSALPTAFSAPLATPPTVPTSLPAAFPAVFPASLTTFGALGMVSFSCIRLPT